METVAVYSELPVKTYGYRAESGHILLSFVCPLGEAAKALRILAGAGLEAKAPLLSGCARGEDYLVKACLPNQQAKALNSVMQKAGFSPHSAHGPVALIHLQGPHFGDRFGITELAFKALARAGAEPRAMGAAVHSVCLVVDEDAGEAAVKELGEYFSRPE